MKKIIICIHNPFALDNLFYEIKNLSKFYEVTVIISNFLITKELLKKYKEFSDQAKLKYLFIIPFYSNIHNRSILSILNTHFFLNKIKKIVNFKNFDVCIFDSSFFIWQKIILNNFLSKKSIKVAIYLDGITLDLSLFKDLVKGENVYKIISQVHKFRNKKKAIKDLNKKNFLKKIFNTYAKFKDIFLDKKIFSFLFYKKEFPHEDFDIKIMDNLKFDYKICFFESSYFFWKKIYLDKCYFIDLKKTCFCISNKKKEKILFIAGEFRYLDLDESIKKIFDFANFLKKEVGENKLIDIRFHPQEDILSVNEIKKKIKKKYINVNFISSDIPLCNISCNYDVVFGAVSGALLYMSKFCPNLKIYCLKSLSISYFGEDYFLKTINENILNYDDLKNNYDNSSLNIESSDVKKISFEKFINQILPN